MPCTTTIHKHLLAIKIGCGFDEDFFNLLKKKFETKSEQQKIEVLVLDQLFLRESISANTRSLTYHGLEDFGEGLDIGTRASEKANHALVLML